MLHHQLHLRSTVWGGCVPHEPASHQLRDTEWAAELPQQRTELHGIQRTFQHAPALTASIMPRQSSRVMCHVQWTCVLSVCLCELCKNLLHLYSTRLCKLVSAGSMGPEAGPRRCRWQTYLCYRRSLVPHALWDLHGTRSGSLWETAPPRVRLTLKLKHSLSHTIRENSCRSSAPLPSTS